MSAIKANARIDELDPGVRFFATRYFAAFTSPAFTTLTHSPLLRAFTVLSYIAEHVVGGM